MDSDGPSLGELVRRGRVRRGDTQEDLARRSGVSVRTISNLESGRITAPRLSSLRAIATALDLDAEATAELCAFADRAAAPAPVERPARRGGLIREPLTRLLGRDVDVAALTEELASGPTRLVTVTGMAGIGKTRLAQAVGRAVQRRGVAAWWVPLAPLEDAGLVLAAVADAVGAPEPTAAAIGRLLPGGPAVLVVDNAEHLPGADAVVTYLLDRLPDVAVLATGRAPLRIAGEREWPLTPLPVPRAGDGAAAVGAAPATRLLVDRVRAATPGFAVTEANAGTVAEICALLDGLPLALELAAAQWRVLGGDAVLRAIRDDPLDVHTPDPGAPDHRSLRVALTATCDLLTADQRAAMRALSVFRGGWSFDAAVAVLDGDVYAHLDRLMALGLVQAGDTDVGRRFSMLPTIVAFASAEAGPQHAVAERHARWFLNWAKELKLVPDRVIPAGPALHADRDNLRAALAWFDREDPESGLVMTNALYEHWRHSHAAEGLDWYLRFVDRATDPDARARGLRQATWLARHLGDLAQAEDLARRAVRAADKGATESLRVHALLGLAYLIEQRRPGQGLDTLREAVALAERIDNPMLAQATVANLGVALSEFGRFDEALPLLHRAADAANDLGRSYAWLGVQLNIANVLNAAGDHAGADRVLIGCESALATAASPDAVTYWQAQRAFAKLGMGETAAAAEFADAALTGASGDRAHAHTVEARLASAETALALGRMDEAAEGFRLLLGSEPPLVSPIGLGRVLAGLAAASAGPTTAATAIAAFEAVLTEFSATASPVSAERVEEVDRHWSDRMGARWTRLLDHVRDRPLADLRTELEQPPR